MKFTDGIYELCVEYDGPLSGVNFMDIELTSTLGTRYINLVFDSANGINQQTSIDLEEDLTAITGLSYDFLTGEVIAERLGLPINIELNPERLDILIADGMIDGCLTYGDDDDYIAYTLADTHTYEIPGCYNITAWLSFESGDYVTSPVYQQKITVKNLPPNPIIDTYQDVSISLKIAGRKSNTAILQIYEDGLMKDTMQVTRTPGAPNEDTIAISKYLDREYLFVLVYEATHSGENPVWVTFTSGEDSTVYDTLFCTCSGGFYQEEIIDVSYVESVVETNPTYCFDASSSFDLDGSIVSYEWDFGDGSVATGETASHTYDLTGAYEVTLIVTDDFDVIGIESLIISVQS